MCIEKCIYVQRVQWLFDKMCENAQKKGEEIDPILFWNVGVEGEEKEEEEKEGGKEMRRSEVN